MAGPTRYDKGMKRKIAVSLSAELVERVQREVRAGRAPSVSAYVGEALERKLGRDDLLHMLDEMDREFGPPGSEAMEWARSVLGR